MILTLEASEVVPEVKPVRPGRSLFQVLHPVTSYLALAPGVASELKLRGYENIHRRERGERVCAAPLGFKVITFSGFLFLPFLIWQSCPKLDTLHFL
jgi:hypothetical protein